MGDGGQGASVGLRRERSFVKSRRGARRSWQGGGGGTLPLAAQPAGAVLSPGGTPRWQAALPAGGDATDHLMQNWYSPSDAALGNELIDVVCRRRFAGIDLVTSGIPDATTILAPRHFLEQHPLGEKIFTAVREHLRGEALLPGEARWWMPPSFTLPPPPGIARGSHALLW